MTTSLSRSGASLVRASGRFLPPLLVAAILGMTVLTLSAAPLHATANASCSSTGPDSGAYTVGVCLTTPADGTALQGPQTVIATLTVTGTNPPTPGGKLIFYLDGQYLLTDYQAPYTFTLPTDRAADGAHLLEVEALMKDAFLTPKRAAVTVTFANGVTTPPLNNRSFRPATAPAASGSLVVAAAGDGAGGETNETNVTNVIASWNPNLMLYLGDVYEKGTVTEFYNWYGAGSTFYSRFRSITNPTIGNHEYEHGLASGYFDYWDNVPHYYSYDAGAWHFISLDSNSQFGQTAPGSPQYEWLVNDLNSNRAACTVAYWHHPVYNVGPEGNATKMLAIWSLLANRGVDLVLNGHDHDYQRWTPMNGLGQPDPNGMTEIVAGSGGHGVQGAIRTDTRLVAGFDTPPNAYGALRLELNGDGAAYRFVNTQGAVLDSGSLKCSDAPDTRAPSAPTNLSATSASPGSAKLTWTPAADNVGVTGYDLFRNGALLASLGPDPTYTDAAVGAGATYTYQVRARDAARNVSELSNTATLTIPAVLFSDGFESGALAPNWTLGAGSVTVQSREINSGRFAARGTSTSGTANYAFRDVTPMRSDLYYRLWFNVLSQPDDTGNSVRLLNFRDSSTSKASILGVFVSNTGKLGYTNDAGGGTTTSTTSVSKGSWHVLQTHVVINGSAGRVEVWLD
ncbi:MAG: metallophosphoesterase, partial [Chloroflexota bacterium]|nr:metallophosphoesterase [Chloroflexota bacterium]